MSKLVIGFDQNNDQYFKESITFQNDRYFDWYNPNTIQTNYIYPLLLRAMMPQDFSFELSDNVVDDIKNKKCILCFDYTYESRDLTNYNPEIHRYDTYSNVIANTKQRYNLQNIDHMYIDCNPHNTKLSNYNFYFNRWLFMQVTEFLKFKFLVKNKKVRPFKVSSFNRRPDESRFAFVNKVKNNKDILCTLGKPEPQDINFYTEKWPELINQLPLEYDEKLDLDLPNRVSILKEELQQLSYIQVVNESFWHYSPNHMFLNEKTFKPIACLQPFIINGIPGSLKHLRELGFKTFSDWWDESYDLETDVEKRIDKIAELTLNLAEKSHKELADMHFDMYDVLKHNVNVLRKFPLHKNLYDQLCNFSIDGIKYFSA